MATETAAPGTAELLQRLAQSRCAEAWAQLVEELGPRILSVARDVLRDDALAEDACQETFLAVRDHAVKFAAPSNHKDEAARAWVLRVAFHVSLHLLRSRRRARKREVEQARMAANRDAHGMDDRREVMLEELGKLPESLQRAVALHFLARQDYAELSTALGCSEGAAKMRVHRGVEQLRERLGYLGVVMSSAQASLLLSAPGADVGEVLAQAAHRGTETWKKLLESSRSPSAITGLETKGWTFMAKAASGFGVCVLLVVMVAMVSGSGVTGSSTNSLPALPAQEKAALTAPSPGKRWSQWIKNLVSEEPEMSRAAEQGLIAAGPAVLPALKQAWAETARVEGRQRIEAVRKSIYAAHPESALKITVEPPDRKLVLREDGFVNLKVKIENIADQEVTLLKQNAVGNVMAAWTTRILDGMGKEAEMAVMIWKFVDPFLLRSEDFVKLEPGGSFERSHQVLLHFADPLPGTYTVCVGYAFAGQALCEPEAAKLQDECLKCALQAPGVKLELVHPEP